MKYDLLFVFHWECLLGLGFPANETFREKMGKFSVAFRIFSAKINEAKTKLNFAKIRNARKHFRKMRIFLRMQLQVQDRASCIVFITVYRRKNGSVHQTKYFFLAKINGYFKFEVRSALRCPWIL